MQRMLRLAIGVTVGLQAFLCGTYDKLTLDRTAKGKVTMTTTWRYAFVPRLCGRSSPHLFCGTIARRRRCRRATSGAQ